jgi:hypothetical protein
MTQRHTLDVPPGWSRHETKPVIVHDACGYVVHKAVLQIDGRRALVHLCRCSLPAVVTVDPMPDLIA